MTDEQGTGEIHFIGGWVLAKATYRYRKASADSEATLILAEGLFDGRTHRVEAPTTSIAYIEIETRSEK